MRQFKDNSSQSWTLDLPFGAILRVKAASSGKYNLLDAGLAKTLATDEAEFWEVLWHLVSPQAAERAVTADKFGELMAAECLFDARRLFFEAWADFFRQLHRPEAATAVEKINAYVTRAIELTKERLTGSQMAEMDGLVEARMQANLNDLFGGLRGSLGSTPAASPGESSPSSPPAAA